jgi:hypothetical protein
MNINAGTNSYNIRLEKMKEKKRPSFSTIFDKLDARSRKLNPKNPLNAVLTNEQMFRYYLEEVEPQLAGDVDKIDDLENAIGDNSIGDIKLRDFAKLLSGNLESTTATPVYETLEAQVSYSPMVAPLITPPSITTPAPSGTGGAPAPSGTGGAPAPSGTGGAPAPSGTGGAPAPSGTGGAPAPSGTGGAPAPSGTGGAPAPSGTGGAPAPSGTGGAPAPSGTGGAPVPAPSGVKNGNYTEADLIDKYNEGIKLGYTPPIFPSSPARDMGIKDEWIKYTIAIIDYNKGVPKNELKFPITGAKEKIKELYNKILNDNISKPANKKISKPADIIKEIKRINTDIKDKKYSHNDYITNKA